MIVVKCEECNKDIKVYPSRVSRKKYCSRKCKGKNNIGIFKDGHRGFKISKGIQKHIGGYIAIYSPEHPNVGVRNTILEHRLVMEKSIGRYLTKTEVVHHINNNPSDNRIENLQLFNSQKEHAQHHQNIRRRNRENEKS